MYNSKKRKQMGFVQIIIQIILPACVWHTSGTPILDTQSIQETFLIGNGTEVVSHEFPWQVSLRSTLNDLHFCSGIIIDHRTVLTTASCAEFIVSPYLNKVVAGNLDLQIANNSDSHQQIVTVTSVHIHPKYAESTDYSNDIAVLKVNPAFLTTEEVAPIPFLHDSSLVLTGYGIISGWGTKREEEILLSEKLQKAVMNVSLSNQDCQRMLNEQNNLIFVEDSMICITTTLNKNEGENVDSCNGDQGGPLIIYENNTAILVGLIQFGIGCGRPNIPSFCTRVSPFVDFIRQYQET